MCRPPFLHKLTRRHQTPFRNVLSVEDICGFAAAAFVDDSDNADYRSLASGYWLLATGYCYLVGPEFVNLQESDCYAFGDTREQAIANYAARCEIRCNLGTQLV
jgi:hypothetical protein